MNTPSQPKTPWMLSTGCAEYCIDRYWMPFFTPHGYGYRFDSMANVMATLVGECSEDRPEMEESFLITDTWDKVKERID